MTRRAATLVWQPRAARPGVALCLGSLSPDSFMGGLDLQGQVESIQRQAVIKDRRHMQS